MVIRVQTTGNADFEIANVCVGEMLDAAAKKWANRVGWDIDNLSITFRQMFENTNKVAKSLIACDIKKGDVVALWTPNLAEFIYCKFACAKLGAIFVAINTRSKNFELEHILKHGEVKLIVMVDRFLKHDFISTLEAICPKDSWLGDGKVNFAQLPYLKQIVSLSTIANAKSLSWENFLRKGVTINLNLLQEVQSKQSWNDEILLQYTSGTTAKPKGALCDHRYVLYSSVERLVRLGLCFEDSFLNTQPFYHVGGSGILTVPLIIGCKVVSTEYYESERILQLIEKKQCTVRSGHAAMYTMELDHPGISDFDLSSLRSGWCIGPQALMQRVRDEMNITYLAQIYGMTEGGGTGGHFMDSWNHRSTTCGKVLSGMEIMISDPKTGDKLPNGMVGEICTRGWLQMTGYFKQPSETKAAIDSGGWLHSGDLGTVDEQGYLKFVGRVKDMLRIGGENVSAEEVEGVLLSHPSIAQAAVIGSPDSRLTEVVMAVIETRNGCIISEEEVKRFCGARMANFRVPRYVRIVDTWPMTGSGKIQKNVLRDMFVNGKI